MNRTIYAAMLLAGMSLASLPAQAIEFDFGGGLNPLNDTAFQSNANTSTLQVLSVVPPGNQPQNVQCIICGTQQPQQDGSFGYNNYKQGGNITTFATSSTSSFAANGHGAEIDNNVLGDGYTGSFLRTFFAAQLLQNAVINVGIDVNTANGAGPEILDRFVVVDLANKTIIADTGIINLSLPPTNNGNGFPDYLITGFDINRNDISSNTQLLFLARWHNTSDGPESFFLVPTIAAVPGPIVGAGPVGLAAAGLFGLNFWRRRRNGGSLPA
jgi:hypothetical protein